MARTWPWSARNDVKADTDEGNGAAKRDPLLPKGGSQDLASNQQAKPKWATKGPLIFYTVMLLASSVGNQVFFKRMTSAMPNYAWYLTQLSTAIYVPFFAALAGPAIVGTAKWDFVQKFAVMGVFDGLSGTLMVLGGVETSGTLQVLLSQAVIPCTIFFSVVMLHKRFHFLQHTGATVIVLGIVLAKAASSSNAGDAQNNPIFNFIFFMAVLPNALSSVFKEVAFRGSDDDLDVNVLQFWVACFQMVTNFVAMPIYSLDILGAQQVPLTQMPRLIDGGTHCLFLLEDQVTMNCGLPGQKPCDHCAGAWIPVACYLAFNVSFNVFTMLVIKHGSAALSFLVATLRMPLASLAFASPLIMGAQAVKPGLSDLISLVVIMLGLCTYRYGGQLLKRAMKAEAASHGEPQPEQSPSGLWPSPNSTNIVERNNQRWSYAPLLSMGMPVLDPHFLLVREKGPGPRTAMQVRTNLIARVGAASPYHSPNLRSHTTPPLLVSPGLAPRSGHSAAASASDSDGMDSPASRKASDYPNQEDVDFDIVGLEQQQVGPRRIGVMRAASRDHRVLQAQRRSEPGREESTATARRAA